MDRIESIILISLIIVFIISILYWQKAFGDDYFTAMRFDDESIWYMKSQPIVCISKPQNMTLINEHITKFSMLKAVNEWEEKANNYTKTKNFNIKIFLPQTQEQLLKCNIIISWVKQIGEKDPVTNTSVAGRTACETKTNDKQVCVIMISEYVIRNALVNNPNGIIKHEMGHALGLSHRYFDNIYDMGRVIVSNDVMTYQNGKYRWITNEDLRVLSLIYGNDGWKEPNYDIGKFVIGKSIK